MSTNKISTDRLVTDLKRVVRDSEELIQNSAGVVGEKALEMRERLAQSLEAAKAACRRLEDKAVDGARATDRVIRDHPYPSIGVGFGIGLLIGVLVARR